MTRGAVYRVTSAPRRRRTRRDWRAVARGVWAVVVLCTSAVDHFVAALAGTRPVAYCTRALASALRAEYRRARGAPAPVPDPAVIDGAVITDTDTSDTDTSDTEGAH